MSEEPQVQADTLRGILRVTVGGEERRIRKLKLHPAEEWFDRNARALGPLAQIDAESLEGDLVKTSEILRSLGDAVLAAVVDYDSEGVLGGTRQLGNELYPEELLPLFLAMRDAALPFVDLLTDRRVLSNAGSPSASSTSGPTPIGATIPTPSDSASMQASSKRSGMPAASV